MWDSLWTRRAIAGTAADMPKITDFLTREQASELLKLALTRGGDFAEVYGEYTMQPRSASTRASSRPSSTASSRASACACWTATRSATPTPTTTTWPNLRDARAGRGRDRDVRQGRGRAEAVRGQRRRARRSRSSSPGAARARRGEEDRARSAAPTPAARGDDPRITQVPRTLADTAKRILVANSDGLWVEDRDQFISRLTVLAIAIDGRQAPERRRQLGRLGRRPTTSPAADSSRRARGGGGRGPRCCRRSTRRPAPTRSWSRRAGAACWCTSASATGSRATASARRPRSATPVRAEGGGQGRGHLRRRDRAELARLVQGRRRGHARRRRPTWSRTAS